MARAMWSGSISFGMVNIPVKLHSAVRDHSIHFHMMSKDGQCRLRRKLVCPETDEEYDFEDTARGYEVAPGQYIIIRDEELASLKPEPGKAIDILDFVELEQIDPIYYDRSYYLAPDERGVKGYELLLRAMTDQKKVGIAKFVMRGKEYLAALRPMGDIIGLETMRFADEVMAAKEVHDPPKGVKIEKKELDVAERLIDALVTKFDPKKYKDDYRQKVEKLIEKKAKGGKIAITEPTEEEIPPVYNLMEALEKSLKAAKKPAAKSVPKRRRKSA
ncbi:MAG: Ku protein [Phycisphaeraceae bacterium]